MATVAVFENAQQGISWPILDKFAPNLCADKYGEYKGHKRPIMGGRHLEQEPTITVSRSILDFTFYKTA